MPNSGFTGISYPFRINSQGGVTTSTTSLHDVSHINESIQQILGTNHLERVMEAEIYSNVQTSLFEPNDVSLQQVIKSQICEAIRRLEKRVELEENDIQLTVETTQEGEFLFAEITYKVIKYQTYYTTKVKVGEIT